ncbi:MAG TPA: Spo0E family sporulation regulatory protein-aspartic acid phosphatase [Firmicutes bacterium]|nr:Spo0E family sporulation regulatory protein-aspartic acid phosphatase [Bacillota bacterium]
MDRELRSDELNSILSLSKELRQQLQGLTRAGGQLDDQVVSASQKLESALNEYTQIMEQRKNS